jgi:hypothetical protein
MRATWESAAASIAASTPQIAAALSVLADSLVRLNASAREGRRVGAAMIALRALRLTMLAFFLWCIVMTLVGVLPW